jgi:uncharacterized protein (TIGR03067 family)
VIAIDAAGKPVPSDRVEKIGLSYTFDGDKLTIHRADRPDTTSTVTLDASANPKRITINQSPAIRGIYGVGRNALQLCLAVDENPNAGYPDRVRFQGVPKDGPADAAAPLSIYGTEPAPAANSLTGLDLGKVRRIDGSDVASIVAERLRPAEHKAET